MSVPCSGIVCVWGTVFLAALSFGIYSLRFIVCVRQLSTDCRVQTQNSALFSLFIILLTQLTAQSSNKNTCNVWPHYTTTRCFLFTSPARLWGCGGCEGCDRLWGLWRLWEDFQAISLETDQSALSWCSHSGASDVTTLSEWWNSSICVILVESTPCFGHAIIFESLQSRTR